MGGSSTCMSEPTLKDMLLVVWEDDDRESLSLMALIILQNLAREQQNWWKGLGNKMLAVSCPRVCLSYKISSCLDRVLAGF